MEKTSNDTLFSEPTTSTKLLGNTPTTPLEFLPSHQPDKANLNMARGYLKVPSSKQWAAS